MKNLINNVTDNKYTTGTGIAMIALVALKLFKIDLGDSLGFDNSEIALGLGSVISAIMLLFSKDPNKKNENAKPTVQK